MFSGKNSFRANHSSSVYPYNLGLPLFFGGIRCPFYFGDQGVEVIKAINRGVDELHDHLDGWMTITPCFLKDKVTISLQNREVGSSGRTKGRKWNWAFQILTDKRLRRAATLKTHLEMDA